MKLTIASQTGTYILSVRLRTSRYVYARFTNPFTTNDSTSPAMITVDTKEYCGMAGRYRIIHTSKRQTLQIKATRDKNARRYIDSIITGNNYKLLTANCRK